MCFSQGAIRQLKTPIEDKKIAVVTDIATNTSNTVLPTHTCRRHSKTELHEPPSPSTLYMGKRTLDVSSTNDFLIQYRSTKGRQLLMDCLASRSSDIYLSLSEQFLTQSSPPSCGVATLAMVLNSLHIDPGRVWRKPWRWFTEDMLVSCFPLEKTEQTMGLTMEHFGLIAECNGANAQTFYGSNTSLDDFRQCLVSAFAADSQKRLVVAFDREVLGQTGTGHYSPVGAFHAEADMLLILDVARFKYPPYWVPVQVMWEAMRTTDPESRRSRGFFVMSTAPRALPAAPVQNPKALSLEEVVRTLMDASDTRMKNIAADLVHGVRKRLLQCSCVGSSCETLIDCSTHPRGNLLLTKVRAIIDVQAQMATDRVLSAEFQSEQEMRPIDFFTQSMPQLVNELVTLLIIEHGHEFITAEAIESIFRLTQTYDPL